MPDSPVVIGLMLCDQVIVDKDTGKPSPVGIFTGLAVEDFDEPQRFLAVVNVNIRVRRIRFPAAGWYDFVLRVNGEHLSQRRIRVYHKAPGSPG